jgi:cell division protein FtsL
MSIGTRIATPLVWLALLASAVGVVWGKHEARSAFIQLQGMRSDRDSLDIEWGQLKLEQSAWATHGRVEQTAHAQLNMVVPRPDEVKIVQSQVPGK